MRKELKTNGVYWEKQYSDNEKAKSLEMQKLVEAALPEITLDLSEGESRIL